MDKKNIFKQNEWTKWIKVSISVKNQLVIITKKIENRQFILYDKTMIKKSNNVP